MYNLTKQMVMTEEWLRIFSVFVLSQNILRDQAEFTSYEAVSIKYGVTIREIDTFNVM